MNTLLIFSLIFSYIHCLTPIIIKGKCNQGPYEICQANGGAGVVADSNNLPLLMAMLVNNNIPNAYVYGWQDHKRPMVLYPNGALADYHEINNTSEYAFCIGSCPCPANNVVACGVSPQVPCPQPQAPCYQPQAPCCYQPQIPCPQPIVPCPQPCPVYTREESCYPQYCVKKSKSRCPRFPRHTVTHCKERVKNAEPIRVSTSLQKDGKVEFECYNGKEIVLNTYEGTEEIIRKRYSIRDRSDCKYYGLPPVLCAPDVILSAKKLIEKKLGCKVCLYISPRGDLYIVIDKKIFAVELVFRERSVIDVKLKQVSRRARKALIKNGLYPITFPTSERN